MDLSRYDDVSANEAWYITTDICNDGIESQLIKEVRCITTNIKTGLKVVE